MPEEGVAEVRSRLSPQYDFRHSRARRKLGSDEVQDRFGPSEVLCDRSVAREADHESIIDEVDVVFPAGSHEMDLAQLELRELVHKGESNEVFV